VSVVATDRASERGTEKDFFALDFETANESALQAYVKLGLPVSAMTTKSGFSTLIDPEDYFAGINVSIHGIDPKDVAGARPSPTSIPRLLACWLGASLYRATHLTG
jgi:DNA polymerase III epsilon subunit-like protein